MRRSLLSAVTILVVLSIFFITDSGRRSPVEAVPVVGQNSCLGIQSCVSLGANAVIGDNSCNEIQSCVSLNGTVGDNSCNAVQSCVSLSGSVGDGSCNMTQSCVSLSGEAGDRSCLGVQACVSMSGTIGDDSCWTTQVCVSFSGTLGDCERNPACDVDLTKTATPETVAVGGDTTVGYTIRIDFSGDVQLNSVADDRYALDSNAECQAISPSGQPAGALSLPQSFSNGWSVLCEYESELPPGTAGDEFVNTATINIGPSFCVTSADLLPIAELPGVASLELEPLDIAPAACIITEDVGTSAVIPKSDGTIDITTEASVRYLEQRRERSVPNIGAGLSGLFNGMPTPLPTAPSAVAPATSPGIRPPNTGEAGLARGTGALDRGIALGAAAILTLAAFGAVRRQRA